MISHGIPYSSDEDEAHGAPNDPEPIKSGFIQASRFHQSRDPARGRADIPPGGARSWTPRKAGRGRRIGQWQQLNSPFRFEGRILGGVEGAEGRWAAGSEAKATFVIGMWMMIFGGIAFGIQKIYEHRIQMIDWIKEKGERIKK